MERVSGVACATWRERDANTQVPLPHPASFELLAWQQQACQGFSPDNVRQMGMWWAWKANIQYYRLHGGYWPNCHAFMPSAVECSCLTDRNPFMAHCPSSWKLQQYARSYFYHLPDVARQWPAGTKAMLDSLSRLLGRVGHAAWL